MFKEELEKISEFFIQLWKRIDKDDVLTDVEQLALDIFRISLDDDKNLRFLSSHFSTKRYIVTKTYILNKDVNTFIIINPSENKITIVNHQYRYEVLMPLKTMDKMRRMFDDKVEIEREKMEKEILGNITDSLDIVLKKFREKIKTKEKSK